MQQQLIDLQLKTESRLGNITKRVNTTGNIPTKDTFATKNLLSYVLPLIEMLNEEKDNIASEEVRNLLSLALNEKEKLFNIPETVKNEENKVSEIKEKFWSEAQILIAEDQITIRRVVKAGLENKMNCKSENITVV